MRVTSSGSHRRPVWKRGVVAAAGASVVTTVLTLLFSLVGVGLAGGFARNAKRPRPAFVRTTVALSVLSVVQDATFGFDVASALTLMGLRPAHSGYCLRRLCPES